MEDRYAVVRVDQNIVVDCGFSSADQALVRAQEFYSRTKTECYAARLVPIDLDKKPNLVILREQTAAIASTTTSTATRTEQIYHEVQALRTVLTDAFALIQEEAS